MSARVTGYSYSIVVGLLVRRRTMFRNCRILYFLGLLVVFTEVFTTQTETDQLCILGEVPDLTVWLNGTLTVVFNATKGCKVITLFRDGEEGVFYIPISIINGVHTIDVPSIAERFNNATMTLRGADNDGNLLNSTEFKLYTVDNVSAINNLTHSSNCTHTTSCWDPPYSHGLEVTDYQHELRLDDEIVESGVTLDLCVVFNLTILPANEPGYSLSVWARAPPGNGTVTNTSIAAATTPNVSYSTDVAVVPQGAIFILVGEVNTSCPMSYPTEVTVSFSCVPSSSVRRVRIASNGSIEETHSDDIETGHIGCNVTVTTSNLSGKNISEIFSFNSTDVQLLDAKPSEITTGAIDLWMKLAMNSSLRVIEVNVTNSRGNLVNSTRIERPLHQREVTHTTDILPVDQYTTISITHSNYSTPSPSTTVPPSTSAILLSTSTAVPSSTGTPTPTPNVGMIAGVVVAVLILACLVMVVIIVAGIVYAKRRSKSDRLPLATQRTGSDTSGHALEESYVNLELGDIISSDSPPLSDNSQSSPDEINGKQKEEAADDSSTNSHTAANALDKATPPDVPVLRVSLEINNVPTPPVPSATAESSAHVVTDDVPSTVSSGTATENQHTAAVNEPIKTATPTTGALDKASLPPSVQATTPNSDDTSTMLLPLIPPPPAAPSFNRQRSIPVPSQNPVSDLPRRPSQPVLQHSVHDLDQQTLAIAASRPSLTSSNEQELHNLHVLAANIQDTLSTADQPVKFEVPSESPPPSPPPSPPALLVSAQELSYPTQETTYTDDSQKPLFESSPRPSTTSRPQPVRPVPESTTTANSMEQLPDDEQPFLTTGKEVSKKSKTRQSFVK